MKICDFCTAAKIILDFVAVGKSISQLDFMYDLFKDFIESDEGLDFDFDNGLVCRWLNGTAKISSRLTSYYSANGNIEAMAIDIEQNILPLLYDKFMAAEELYHLLMNDTTLSANLKPRTVIYNEQDIYQTRCQNKGIIINGNAFTHCERLHL